MTQRAAAEALGISPVHLSNVERGVTPPSISLISRFTALYGVDVWVLTYCECDRGDDPAGVRRARQSLGEALRQQLAAPAKPG